MQQSLQPSKKEEQKAQKKNVVHGDLVSYKNVFIML